MSSIQHKNFGVKASTHDLLKITQDSILKSVLTEIHATYKLNHYFSTHPISVRPIPYDLIHNFLVVNTKSVTETTSVHILTKSSTNSNKP